MGLPFYQVVAFPGGAVLVGAWLPFRRERSKGNLSFLPRGSLEARPGQVWHPALGREFRGCGSAKLGVRGPAGTLVPRSIDSVRVCGRVLAC